jgi:uncharacterized membrane protein
MKIKLGITSLIVSLALFLVLLYQNQIGKFLSSLICAPVGDCFEMLFFTAGIWALFIILFVVGLMLSVISLFKKSEHKTYAILSVILLLFDVIYLTFAFGIF